MPITNAQNTISEVVDGGAAITRTGVGSSFVKIAIILVIVTTSASFFAKWPVESLAINQSVEVRVALEKSFVTCIIVSMKWGQLNLDGSSKAI